MRLLFCLCFIIITNASAIVQQDSVPARMQVQPRVQTTDADYIPFVDSAALAKANRTHFIADSLTMQYLRPDSGRRNQFAAAVLTTDLSLRTLSSLKPKGRLLTGKAHSLHQPWVIVVIIGLLIYTALLNIFMGNDIRAVLQSFYNKNAISQLEKESGLINSWAFLGLFLLFSLCFGLVLYQLTLFYNVHYSIGGFRLFAALSVIIALLFVLKFLVLKLIGFLFNSGALVSEYIAILNLTYFNVAFVMLAVVVCFSLMPGRYIPALLMVTLITTGVIFAWQYLRNSVGILSGIRFHKFYLIIYLCALEICPVLILIKALII